jgi:ligand-binding sensor domain-containing protein
VTARAWVGWLALLGTLVAHRAGLAERAEVQLQSLPTGDVAALATSEGHLFVGMFDRGLLDLRVDGSVSPARTLNRNINALLVDRAQAKLWVGTARGLFACALQAPAECARVGENKPIHALVKLRDGTVLAGGDGGLLVVAPDLSTNVFDRKQGAPFRAVWALAQASDGTLFVGTTSGVYFAQAAIFLLLAEPGAPRASGRGLARAALVTGDLGDDWVTALAVSNDTLHVGTYNAGIASFRLARGVLTRTTRDPSIGYVNPNGIQPLPDGTLAIATMNGLRVGVPGSFRTVPTLSKDVTAIAPAGASDHWVASRRGVERIRLMAGP